MRMLLLLLLAVSVSFSAVSGADAGRLYKNAGESYLKGKYTEAAGMYEQITGMGFESADLYYNLGNSYFKLKKIPEAILYYERAKKIAPEDEDIDFNLKVANLKIIDKFETIPKLFFVEWFENARDSISSGGWAVRAVIFSWIGFLLLAGFIILWQPALRKLFFGSAVICLVLVILFTVFASERNKFEMSRDEGIIFSASVYVKSSPDEKSTDLFILHEGTKIKLLDGIGNWKKIRLGNGAVGWLPEKSFKRI